jgi:transcriptional regulator with XRE-family HTH domain
MNRLRELRNEKGLSQKALAEILHCAQNTISQWENGTREMDAPVLKKISEYFSVSTDYILGTSDTKKDVPADAYHPSLNEKDERDIQKKLESILADMDDQDRLVMSNGGERMDDETRELMKTSLENVLHIAKLKSKAKYTPKKYRK